MQQSHARWNSIDHDRNASEDCKKKNEWGLYKHEQGPSKNEQGLLKHGRGPSNERGLSKHEQGLSKPQLVPSKCERGLLKHKWELKHKRASKHKRARSINEHRSTNEVVNQESEYCAMSSARIAYNERKTRWQGQAQDCVRRQMGGCMQVGFCMLREKGCTCIVNLASSLTPRTTKTSLRFGTRKLALPYIGSVLAKHEASIVHREALEHEHACHEASSRQCRGRWYFWCKQDSWPILIYIPLNFFSWGKKGSQGNHSPKGSCQQRNLLILAHWICH